MSENIQNLFNTIAPKYDLLNSLLSLSIDRLWRRQAVAHLNSPKINHVLDLCAGTLSMSLELLRQNPAAQIEAVDFSQEMLSRGAARVPVALRANVRLHCADGLELPFPNHIFDGAMCAYGLRNLDDNQKGLAELKRVLKPGGKLVILEFFRPDYLVTKLFQATYWRYVIPGIGRMISGHKNAYKHLRESVKNFYTVSEYTQLLTTCDFRNIEIHSQTGGISTLIAAVNGRDVIANEVKQSPAFNREIATGPSGPRNDKRR